MTSLAPRPPYSDAELASLYPPSLHLQQVQILLRHGERTPVSARFANTGLAAYWPYCSAVSRFRSTVLVPHNPDPSSSSPSSSSSSSSSHSFSDLQWRRRLESFGPNDAAVPASGPDGSLDNLCDLGMLTDRGRETTHALGARLRRLYVDRLGFLPASIADDASSFIYLRATPIPRALESMQQAFLGLYPPHTRDPNSPPLTILSRYSPEETLFPNDMHCRRFAQLSRAFAQRAADKWNDTDEMRYLTTKLGRYMPDDSPRVAVDSKPRLSGIMDTVNSTLAHGPATRLPRDFYDPKLRQIMEKVSVDEWFAGYGESREYRALGIGALLGDVVARMVASAERNVPPPDTEFVPPPGQHHRSSSSAGGKKVASQQNDDAAIRFGLSGCHDTTLAGILASLGAYNTESWPPFTSHIAIELFRSSDKPPASTSSSSSTSSSWWPSFLSPASKHPQPSIYRKPTPELTPAEKESLEGFYVRLRYNDEPVTIPGCKPQGKHFPGQESFCTLAAFKSIVDKFTPKDWQAECRANIKKAAFPEVKEPAGY
ncbi:phosphoglycerate mutase-like protein [Trichoderma longibrachiatum ATCC 18648]|uniref:3-phytase n=1 Tax=Trichoderma longibrachiatum ATCC 18648 TaxID=983965 RepID=A0A2T4BU62_TRILO|nr:phosphoglycerate mutase-like protein [Trichoderma longibrachiatum ATCC 18648]